MSTAGIHFEVTMTDGIRHEVATVVQDQVKWDMTRHKHKWPTFQEAPTLFQNFLAYVAMKRLGLYSGTWDAFQLDAAGVEVIGEDETDEDPTRPGGSE